MYLFINIHVHVVSHMNASAIKDLHVELYLTILSTCKLDSL